MAGRSIPGTIARKDKGRVESKTSYAWRLNDYLQSMSVEEGMQLLGMTRQPGRAYNNKRIGPSFRETNLEAFNKHYENYLKTGELLCGVSIEPMIENNAFGKT